MAQLYTQTQPRFAAWHLLGPATATSVAASQSLTVTFEDSSTVTIAPNVPAVLQDGTTTTWDRSSAVFVIYVLKGDPTLRAVRESQLSLISTDYAPLVRTLHDSILEYEPQQPGGTPDVSGAWSGGASIGVGRAIEGGGYYGILDSQSITGGASS